MYAEYVDIKINACSCSFNSIKAIFVILSYLHFAILNGPLHFWKPGRALPRRGLLRVELDGELEGRIFFLDGKTRKLGRQIGESNSPRRLPSRTHDVCLKPTAALFCGSRPRVF